MAQLISEIPSSPAALRFQDNRATCCGHGIRGSPSPRPAGLAADSPPQRLPKLRQPPPRESSPPKQRLPFLVFPHGIPKQNKTKQNPTCSCQPPGCPCKSPAWMPDTAAFPGVPRDPSRPASSQAALEPGSQGSKLAGVRQLTASLNLGEAWRQRSPEYFPARDGGELSPEPGAGGYPPRAGSAFSTAGPELEFCSGLLAKPHC